jgi:hypothetical protein
VVYPLATPAAQEVGAGACQMPPTLLVGPAFAGNRLQSGVRFALFPFCLPPFDSASCKDPRSGVDRGWTGVEDPRSGVAAGTTPRAASYAGFPKGIPGASYGCRQSWGTLVHTSPVLEEQAAATSDNRAP